MSEVVPFRRQRVPFAIPASAALAVEALGLPFPLTLLGVEFSLHRSKRGTEIFFHSPNRFSWNVSHAENVWPPSFAEARMWVAAFGARHGQALAERKGVTRLGRARA